MIITATLAFGFPWVSTLCTARAPKRQAGQVGETSATSRGKPLLSLNVRVRGRRECESEVTAGRVIPTPVCESSRLAAQRPRAKLPGGSGQLLPTLRHTGRQGKLQVRPSPLGQSKILVMVQGFSELLGRRKRASTLNAMEDDGSDGDPGQH